MVDEPTYVVELKRELGQRLADLRKAAGATQQDLARHTFVDRTYVSHAERAQQMPERAFWVAADDYLNAGGSLRAPYDELVAAQHAIKQAQLDALRARHQVPSSPTFPGTLVLRSTIPSSLSKDRRQMRVELLAHYEALTDNYRQIDYQAGARAVYSETAAHLNRLLATVDQVPSSLYRRFILGLGDAAQLAAWLAIDSQDYGTARQYCALALSSAEEGEDPNLHSYVLGVMSYIHLHAGRGSEAVRLLEAALRVADERRFGVNPAIRSWLYEAMGEAYAIAGNREAGARALARAEQLFDAVCSDTVPDWLSFFNAEGHVARLKGRCLMRLGDGQAAITTLETACELLPEHYVREQSGTLIDLAAAHLLEANANTQPAEPVAAAEIAREAWRLAVVTESNRNQRRIRELLPQFAPYAHLESVQALDYTVR
jgi:transcriptional regulator with XRE-family HTH domain